MPYTSDSFLKLNLEPSLVLINNNCYTLVSMILTMAINDIHPLIVNPPDLPPKQHTFFSAAATVYDYITTVSLFSVTATAFEYITTVFWNLQ